MGNMASRARSLDLFFAHIGWPEFVRFHVDFPLRNWQGAVSEKDWRVGVTCTDKRTGEIVTLWSAKDEFPSNAMIAGFRLLCGPIPEIMAAYEKSLNRRQDRGRRRR